MEEKTEDICPQCRIEAMVFSHQTWRITHVKQWCTLWLYRGNVRDALIRFKFMRRPGYGSVFGRELAEKLKKENYSVDVITWVPTGFLRKRKRTYDQVELIARAAAKELGVAVTPTLRKIRHNRPQSTMKDAAARRANVLGVYRVTDPAAVAGKRILILDDILTTGATLSECARTLLTAGAKEVNCATVAVASHQRHNSR